MTLTNKSVALNSVFFFVAQLATAILAFATSIIIARKAGPYITGQYSYLVWLGATFTTVSTLGIPNAVIKFTAEYFGKRQIKTAKSIAGQLLLFCIILGIISAMLLSFLNLMHWLPSNSKYSYVYPVAAVLPLNIISTYFVGLFKGNRQYKTLMLANIFAALMTFIAILIVLHYQQTLGGLIIYYSLAAIILFACYVVALIGKVDISFKKVSRYIRQPIMKYIGVVSAIILLDQVVWNRSEVLFLSHYSSPQQVAFYSLAYTLTSSIMTLLPGSIIGALLPHIAGLYGSKNIPKIQASYNTSTKYIGLIVGFLIAGGIALATPIIYTLYGYQYIHMVTVFRLLVFSAGWASIVGIASTVMYGMTRQGFLLVVGLLLSVINIILDFVIIPHHGATGAGIANGITQLLGGILTIYLLEKKVGLNFPWKSYTKIGIISTVSCLIILYFSHIFGGHNIIGLVSYSVMFIIIFFSFTFVLKLITPRELSLITLRKLKNNA